MGSAQAWQNYGRAKKWEGKKEAGQKMGAKRTKVEMAPPEIRSDKEDIKYNRQYDRLLRAGTH